MPIRSKRAFTWTLPEADEPPEVKIAPPSDDSSHEATMAAIFSAIGQGASLRKAVAEATDADMKRVYGEPQPEVAEATAARQDDDATIVNMEDILKGLDVSASVAVIEKRRDELVQVFYQMWLNQIATLAAMDKASAWANAAVGSAVSLNEDAVRRLSMAVFHASTLKVLLEVSTLTPPQQEQAMALRMQKLFGPTEGRPQTPAPPDLSGLRGLPKQITKAVADGFAMASPTSGRGDSRTDAETPAASLRRGGGPFGDF